MKLNIGGKLKEIEVKIAGDLLRALHLAEDGRGIAIAINDAVVPKSRWGEYELHEGDRVEIVKAVQGG